MIENLQPFSAHICKDFIANLEYTFTSILLLKRW